MKKTVKMEKVIEISAVGIVVPVNYEEEDIPNDFPMRNGDTWKATVDIDTGVIEGWPIGKTGRLHMKVCDGGTYSLIGSAGEVLAVRNQEYVPHGVIPGEYGDYIDLQIDATGKITNWPKNPDVGVFFGESED